MAESMDRGESTTLMEPLLLSHSSRWRGPLNDLALELTEKSAHLRGALPADIATSLAGLVRAMNCYYSNLIEGHATHPVDIERALAKDVSAKPEQRALQLEALAHVEVQAWIDGGGLAGRSLTGAGLSEIHARFCGMLPEDLLWVTGEGMSGTRRVEPGAYRKVDVAVGGHVPVSPGAVPRFMARFESAHAGLGRGDTLLAAATAHHRLLWIHPFLDGNGRVARLMSHALLGESVKHAGIWSVARGLARNVAEYKRRLAECDQGLRNDLDGRGNLSEEALAGFAGFFLRTCLDQAIFMEGLIQPDRLRARALDWARAESAADRLPPKSDLLLEAALHRGRVPRGEAAGLLGVGERQARRVASALIGSGALASDGPRDPLRLAFSARLAQDWMPGLFPEWTPEPGGAGAPGDG